MTDAFMSFILDVLAFKARVIYYGCNRRLFKETAGRSLSSYMRGNFGARIGSLIIGSPVVEVSNKAFKAHDLISYLLRTYSAHAKQLASLFQERLVVCCLV